MQKMMNRKRLLTIGVLLTSVWTLYAQPFETAAEAVKNMGVGWNLGNTLDANNGGACPDIAQSETMWGQPITKPELLTMMKEAGFGAIRVPVTWYPHMDSDGNVDGVWMARVREVVDYVLNNGMYCILNVHHDTGEGTMWLHASTKVYASVKDRYAHLWRQIAEEFKDYGERLLFESYNEMLDEYNSWCFASFAASSYNATAAADAYKAINLYAQDFVDVVRATGGNNAKRNLIVNTYGACNGGGSWNSHLQDPLKNMELPADTVAGSGHIAFEVHAYPTLATAKSETNDIIKQLNAYLLPKAPVIMGEWGTGNPDPSASDYMKDPEKYLDFVRHFVEKAKEKDIATFYWMGLSDGAYRAQPVFNQPDIAEAIVKTYYGSADGFKYPTIENAGGTMTCFEGEKALGWGNGIAINNSMFAAFGQSVQLVLSYTVTNDSGADIQFYYGDWSEKLTFTVDGKTYNEDYNPDGGNGTTQTTVVTFDEPVYTALTQKGLMIHGSSVTMTKIVLQKGATGVRSIVATLSADNCTYDLKGHQVTIPRRGIFIQNSKKFVVK